MVKKKPQNCGFSLNIEQHFFYLIKMVCGLDHSEILLSPRPAAVTNKSTKPAA
jgi:hypothetical protein